MDQHYPPPNQLFETALILSNIKGKKNISTISQEKRCIYDIQKFCPHTQLTYTDGLSHSPVEFTLKIFNNYVRVFVYTLPWQHWNTAQVSLWFLILDFIIVHVRCLASCSNSLYEYRIQLVKKEKEKHRGSGKRHSVLLLATFC